MNGEVGAITVVIPAYNAEKCVGRAIGSAQIGPVKSIIVVDDGSSDGTSGVAQAAGVSTIRQANAGAAASRMAGLKLVTSEYVVFLDADDELLADGVEAALAWLDQNREAVGVVSGYKQHRVASSDGKASSETEAEYVPPWNEEITTQALIDKGRSPGPPACMVWRTEQVRAAAVSAPAPLQPRLAEDYETLIRLSLVGVIGSLRGPSCLYAAVGGKSTRHPLADLQAAEHIRAYYGSTGSFTYVPRSSADLAALSLFWKASLRRPRDPAKVVIMIGAIVRSPLFSLRAAVAKVARSGRSE